MDELEAWCRKAERIKGEYWSMVQAYREGRSLAPQQIKRVDDFSKEVEDILGHCGFQKGLTTHAARCRKSSPLVTTELVGENSEETIKRICAYLMKDEIFIIGIYGMRGLGKTAILMHVHNRILGNPAFDDVFWITVPRKFSVYELQDEIANAVGLENLSKDKDVKRRACALNRHMKEKRAVLILDDLWMHFEIEDVGIPIEKGGLKLVLTTQSLDVCHKMLCQKHIKIDLLDKQDSWSLFEQKLCFGGKLPSEIEEIAQSILYQCYGLPLGIIEIATRMRGMGEVHKWRGMLWKLTNSKVELDVFKRLKLDYMNLGDSQVQRCFLHLIFFFKFLEFGPNDTKLIESFIDEGLLGGIGTRQELHDQGYIVLDKLRKGCLWDLIEGEDHFISHPLIRGMAHVVKSTTHMVKDNMGLKEILEEELWAYHLEKVFLQGNYIKEIPYGISPNCPKLTRLSLNDNVSLEAIHESFFKHLNGLKVLDLSNTKITKLPDPITHLQSLEALLLRECKELSFIPGVRKLESLKKLDLNGCAMFGKVPEGMEMLVKLTYLDLVGTRFKTSPEGLLRNLVNLQYLEIQCLREGEEVKLEKVEALYCSIPNVEIFNACVRFLEQNSSQCYQLRLNVSTNDPLRYRSERIIIIKSCRSIAARVAGEIAGDGHALLPKNVEVLEVGRCGRLTSLCKVGPLMNMKELQIEEWEKLEELGALHFPHLQRLKIIRCSKLKHLLNEMQWLPCLRWFEIQNLEELEGINIVAPSLTNIVVDKCPKMKRVVVWEWLDTHLPNLKCIRICDCEKLEEIIGGPVPSDATCFLTTFMISRCNNMRVLLTHDMLLHVPLLRILTVQECKGVEVIIGHVPNMTHSSIPNLTHLFLKNLPELKSICDGIVNCVSIQYIDISECPKLKRISLQLPQLDDGHPTPPRSLWIDQHTWDSLEWDHPLARSSLQCLVQFRVCLATADEFF
ncbi:hypothetical protein EUGRSUZ_I00210 [Eucalyptus grandis]|uniref:Uncharacterized protein n=2 Tax=Eucalyptus grandis TaxID=71139 RepID=A0A059AKK2_EUCGR|nr:hypothetical protein EUGRSUZ_I00210 [Eucalyptus grandis]